MDVSILDFGAKIDNRNNSVSIQNAIDYCHQNGGGKVIVPKGTFVTGSITIKNNVYLYLEKNAILLGSSNLDDYLFFSEKKNYINKVTKPTYNNCDYNGKPAKYFIRAINAKAFGIMGSGIIDGNERIYYGNITKWHIDGYFYPRIPLLYLENCCDFILEDVTLRNSAFWTCHMVGCHSAIINKINILNNTKLANSDGIDPDHCNNIHIKNCNITSADDCIVFKNTEAFEKYGPTYNMLVENCNLISTSAAIKFGTESVDDFYNIHIKNIKIEKSNRGISLQLRDKGNIYNTIFNNITIETRRFSPDYWWGRAEGIAITALNRNENTTCGKIHDIEFNNININGENGIFIYGNNNIDNLIFNNVNVNLKETTSWSKDTYDLRPSTIGVIPGGVNVLYSNQKINIKLIDFKYTIDNNIINSLNIENELTRK